MYVSHARRRVLSSAWTLWNELLIEKEREWERDVIALSHYKFTLKRSSFHVWQQVSITFSLSPSSYIKSD